MAGLTLLAGLALAALASSAGALVVTDSATGHKFGVVPRPGSASGTNSARALPRGLSLTAPLSGSCNADDSDCTQLSYNGGPVQHGEQDYLFFWAPPSYVPGFPATYVTGLQSWLTDIAAASGSNGNPLSVNQQYYDCSSPCTSKSFVPYTVQNAGTRVDSTPYPTSQNCPVGGGYTVCLTDAQIQAELSSYIAANHLPTGLNVEYFVFTPQGVNTCLDTTSGTCASNTFCGYHSDFGTTSDPTLYANLPWLYGISGCDVAANGTPQVFGHANTNFTDPVTSVFSHELSETMTDPEPATGWVQNGGPDDGYEIGDKCAYIYGAGGYLSSSGLQQLSNLAYYNVQLGADNYLLQLEFDNQRSTCEGSLAQPASTSLPSVAGTATLGQTLSESHGGWTPSATSYAYQWEDCDGSGASCAAISGATAQTYTLTGTDVGHTIRVQETGSNEFGPGVPSTSAATSVVTPLVPASSGVPRVSGVLQQSQVLTESHGSWLNGPTGYSYEWEDCNSAGTGCSPIAGATGQVYTLTASDVGHAIRVQETASNAEGAGAPATSAATTAVIPLAPSNTTAPTIAGAVTEGQRVTEAHGSWANTPTSYAYQWMQCDSSGRACSPIAGAATQSYRLTAADIGHRLRIVETAANAGGAGAASSSQATGLVSPSPGHVSRALSSVVSPSAANRRITRLLSANGYTLSFSAPSGGSLQIVWRAGHVAVATARFTVRSAGVYRLKLNLTSAGRKLLQGASQVQLRSTAAFRPKGGGARGAARKFKLSR